MGLVILSPVPGGPGVGLRSSGLCSAMTELPAPWAGGRQAGVWGPSSSWPPASGRLPGNRLRLWDGTTPWGGGRPCLPAGSPAMPAVTDALPRSLPAELGARPLLRSWSQPPGCVPRPSPLAGLGSRARAAGVPGTAPRTAPHHSPPASSGACAVRSWGHVRSRHSTQVPPGLCADLSRELLTAARQPVRRLDLGSSRPRARTRRP